MSSTNAGLKKTSPRRLLRVDYWFQNVSSFDLKFIGVLWSSEFIIPWVHTWAQGPQSQLVDPNSYLFLLCYFSLLIVKLISTIAVSLVVDLKNHKFTVYFASLLVFCVSPVFGIVASIVYNDGMLYFIPLWFTVSLFVTYPTKFSLIFDQSPNASVTDTRKLVSFFEMLRSLSLFVLFVFLYFIRKTFTFHVLIAGWIIFIFLTAGLIFLTTLIKKYTTKEVIKEFTFREVYNGTRLAVTKNQGLNTVRFVLFVSLLLPVLAITSVDVTLTVLNEFASSNVDHSMNVNKFLAKLIVVPAIGLLLSGARGIFGRIGDLLVIAVAHIFNIIVISLIVRYFGSEHIIIDTRSAVDHTSSTIVGHLPNSERAVVRIFCAFREKYNLRTTTFNVSEPLQWVEFEVYIKRSPLRFEIQIQKLEKDKLLLKHTTELEPNKRYWFMVLPAGGEIKELIQMIGIDQYRPFPGMKMYLLNGITRTVHQQLLLYEEESGLYTTYYLPPNNMAVNIILNVSRYRFYFDTVKSDFVEFFPHSEFVIVIFEEGTVFSATFNLTLQIQPERATRNNELLHASYVLNGLTQAATSVGYLHFFWMESPLRLRTTLLACFLVINEIVAEMTKLSMDYIGFNEAVTSLALSIFAGLFHVALGILYDSRYRHDLMSPEEIVSKAPTPLQPSPSPPPQPQQSTSAILVSDAPKKTEEKRGWFG